MLTACCCYCHCWDPKWTRLYKLHVQGYTQDGLREAPDAVPTTLVYILLCQMPNGCKSGILRLRPTTSENPAWHWSRVYGISTFQGSTDADETPYRCCIVRINKPVSVCVHLYLFISVHTHVHTHTGTHTHMYMYVHIYIYMYIYTHAYTCLCT